MKTNKLHQQVVTEDDMIEVLYRNDAVREIVVDQGYWAERLKKSCFEFDLPITIEWTEESDLTEDEFITQNLSDWSLPEVYAEFDIENYLLSKCETAEQLERVQEELQEFKQRDMIGVLKWLKYFVDTLRENDLIWGVGRGSSVASYVLFLLEVHRVDSLQYDLDIKEFLK